MESSTVFAGFGGQGVLSLGKIVASAALAEGREVSWLPSYGPEMRGGTANCTVVISDRPIGSPVVRRSDVAVVMNIPSCRKFGPLVRPGGILLVNSTLIPEADIPARDDLRVVRVPATGIAIELGAAIAANMVMLGAYLAATQQAGFAGQQAGFASGAVSPKMIDSEIEHLFSAKPKALALNRRAVERGMETAQASQEAVHA